MTDTSETTHEAATAANELYWGSENSVNQIAEQLNLSKGALYGMVRPLPAGSACPLCGGEVVSANRTARDRGVLSCPDCEWDGDEDETLSLAETLPEHMQEDDDTVSAPFDRGRTRIVVGGALLGAAAGLALVMWTRRGSR